MNMGLEGKTAVITGGASGLGRETARYLTAEGTRVVIADINADAIAETVAELREGGGEAEGITVDVVNYEDCKAMAALAVDKFGSLDVVVAAAGIAHGTFFVETEPADWERMMAININGVMNTNHACAKTMLQTQVSGSIVNIASEAGKVGEKRMVVYGATKGAVIGFTKCLATELGRNGIRVNAVCPGVTKTPMTAYITPDMEAAFTKFYPLKRLGLARDIASTITFLASEQSSWITGQAISVSGGFSRC